MTENQIPDLNHAIDGLVSAVESLAIPERVGLAATLGEFIDALTNHAREESSSGVPDRLTAARDAVRVAEVWAALADVLDAVTERDLAKENHDGDT